MLIRINHKKHPKQTCEVYSEDTVSYVMWSYVQICNKSKYSNLCTKVDVVFMRYGYFASLSILRSYWDIVARRISETAMSLSNVWHIGAGNVLKPSNPQGLIGRGSGSSHRQQPRSSSELHPASGRAC